MTSIDLADNISALCLAILSPRQMSVERAFMVVGDPRIKAKWMTTDSMELVKLKELGMSLDEIGEVFGVDKSTVCKLIKKEEKKWEI